MPFWIKLKKDKNRHGNLLWEISAFWDDVRGYCQFKLKNNMKCIWFSSIRFWQRWKLGTWKESLWHARNSGTQRVNDVTCHSRISCAKTALVYYEKHISVCCCDWLTASLVCKLVCGSCGLVSSSKGPCPGPCTGHWFLKLVSAVGLYSRLVLAGSLFLQQVGPCNWSLQAVCS